MSSRKIKIIIVEDEFVIAEDIRSQLVDHDYEVPITFSKAEDALPRIIQDRPDMILVDINLSGKMDGIELVKNVQTKMDIPVVYITANSDETTYERARATRPAAFLIKPFSPANLLASVDLGLFNFSNGKVAGQGKELSPPKDSTELLINQCLFIRTNGRYKKVHGDDILFVEASGSYAHIQTIDNRYTISQNLANFLRKTPLPSLVRIHRSFIVNINKVDSFEESLIFISNHKLPLSDTFKEEFMARIHTI